jgi:hypothetical protein
LAEAQEAFDRAEAVVRAAFPAGWHRVHNYLGAVYTAMERHAEAKDSYERVLASPSATDGDRATARKGLAELAS